MGTMALQPPPAIGAFLIGFTAKRASWLGGLIYGIFVTHRGDRRPADAGRPPAHRRRLGATRSSSGHAAWSPIGAALFASAAAWYRRFLDLANPNRQASSSRPRKAKPKPAR